MFSAGWPSPCRPNNSRLLTTPSLFAPMSTRISSLSIRTTVPSTTSPCLKLLISVSCSARSSSIVVGSGPVGRGRAGAGVAAAEAAGASGAASAAGAAVGGHTGGGALAVRAVGRGDCLDRCRLLGVFCPGGLVSDRHGRDAVLGCRGLGICLGRRHRPALLVFGQFIRLLP